MPWSGADDVWAFAGVYGDTGPLGPVIVGPIDVPAPPPGGSIRGPGGEPIYVSPPAPYIPAPDEEAPPGAGQGPGGEIYLPPAPGEPDIVSPVPGPDPIDIDPGIIQPLPQVPPIPGPFTSAWVSPERASVGGELPDDFDRLLGRPYRPTEPDDFDRLMSRPYIPGRQRGSYDPSDVLSGVLRGILGRVAGGVLREILRPNELGRDPFEEVSEVAVPRLPRREPLPLPLPEPRMAPPPPPPPVDVVTTTRSPLPLPPMPRPQPVPLPQPSPTGPAPVGAPIHRAATPGVTAPWPFTLFPFLTRNRRSARLTWPPLAPQPVPTLTPTQPISPPALPQPMPSTPVAPQPAPPSISLEPNAPSSPGAGASVDLLTAFEPTRVECDCPPGRKTRRRKNPSNKVATVEPYRRRMSRNSLANLRRGRRK